MKSRLGWTLLLLSSAGVCAYASEASSSAAQPEVAPSGSAAAAPALAAMPEVPQPPPATPTAAAPAGDLIQVPALTPLKLKLGDPVSSNVNKPGDRFRLFVVEDVKMGDAVVIPAGTAGEGEVIHAAKSSAGGKAGELLLTARFLRVGEQTVRLRSFVLGGAGADRSNQALATSFVAGPFAMFVRGGVIIIPIDAVATAKTLEIVQLPATQPGPTEPTAAPASAPEPPAPQAPEAVPLAEPTQPAPESQQPPVSEPGP